MGVAVTIALTTPADRSVPVVQATSCRPTKNHVKILMNVVMENYVVPNRVTTILVLIRAAAGLDSG